jgi:Prp8 binding protein
MSKRAAPQEEGSLIKRARSSEPEANNQQLTISSSNDERQKALVRSVKRTSNLEAPIVSLSGSHAVSPPHQVPPGYSKRRVPAGRNTKLQV